jgi:hypothetical protein
MSLRFKIKYTRLFLLTKIRIKLCSWKVWCLNRGGKKYKYIFIYACKIMWRIIRMRSFDKGDRRKSDFQDGGYFSRSLKRERIDRRTTFPWQVLLLCAFCLEVFLVHFFYGGRTLTNKFSLSKNWHDSLCLWKNKVPWQGILSMFCRTREQIKIFKENMSKSKNTTQ